MYTYRLPQTYSDCPINVVRLAASAYEYGHIVIQIKPNMPSSNTLLSDLTAWVHAENVEFGITNIGVMLIHDFRHTESLYDMLVAKGHIRDGDRANFVELKKEAQKFILERASVTNSATSSQKSTLLSIAEVYVDDLIGSTSNHSVVVKLIAAAFALSFSQHKDRLATLLQEHEIDSSILDSIEALWKMCHGQAYLEKTHSRLGGSIPSLIAQRLIILEYAVRELLKKHPGLSDQEQLYLVMGILLFQSETQVLSPLQETRPIIENSLRDQTIPSALQLYFGNSDVMLLTTHAFKYMGIMRAEQLPDLERLEALQKAFSSEAMTAYIATIRKMAEAQSNPDPLSKALEDDNPEEVKRILTLQPERINEFFECGRTPLIYAFQSCGPEVVRVILSFDPDVNKLTQRNIFGPLGALIASSRIEFLDELLQRGANPFLPCGALTPPKSEFHERAQSIQIGNAIMRACSSYQHQASDDMAEIIFTLLDNGACLGYNFPSQIQLPRKPKVIVAIGGSFPVDKDTIVVTTYEQFLEHIPRSDYPKWIKRLEQFQQLATQNPNSLNPFIICAHLLQHMKNEILGHRLPSSIATTTSTQTSHLTNVGSSATTADRAPGLQSGGIFTPMTRGQMDSMLLGRIRLKRLVEQMITLDEQKPILDSLENKQYNHALQQACSYGRLDLVKLFEKYNKTADLNLDFNTVSDNGETLLDLANKSGNAELSEFLRMHGAKSKNEKVFSA